MKVVWTRDALRDVQRIAAYLQSLNPAAARRVLRELVLAGDGLAVFPRRGRQGKVATTRELTVVWPYIIVYEVQSDRVTVLRVWHGAQDRP